MAKIDPQEVVKFTLPLWTRLVRWGLTALLTLVSAERLISLGLTAEQVLGASTIIGGFLAWGTSYVMDKIANKMQAKP